MTRHRQSTPSDIAVLQPAWSAVEATAPDTETCSNTPVASADVVWLLTASPASTVDGSDKVADPTVVHNEPFVETYGVIRLPARVSRTHRGAVPLPPDVLVVTAPLAVDTSNPSS